MKNLVLCLFLIATLASMGQSVLSPGGLAKPPSSDVPAGASAPPPRITLSSSAQVPIDRLAETNQELLDLLKKQQAVLEDIQYDRRLQNRQIQLIEVRLEDTLQLNATLQAKVARLEGAAAQVAAGTPSTPGASKMVPTASSELAPPPPPASYLPTPEMEGAPGTMSWHRLFVISGAEAKTSDTFNIKGNQWRVLWHNQDRPGPVYKNTSALFISAFPKGDSIPKKVCSKLGTGGDSTELTGSGNYFLKIEASGGGWEVAVEDFR